MREMKKRKLKIYFVPISWYGLQSEMQCCKRFHKIAENDSKPALNFIQNINLIFIKSLLHIVYCMNKTDHALQSYAAGKNMKHPK